MQNITNINAKASEYVTKKTLLVGEYRDIYGRFGSLPMPRKDQVPMNSSTTVKWRRYEHLPLATTPIVRGITPDSVTQSVTDLTANLVQHGSYVVLDDVSIMSVEDPLLDIEGDRCADQAIRSLNVIREGVLQGGTSVAYANGSQRTDVNTLISASLISKTARTMTINMARKLTKMLTATDGYNSSPIPACFVGVAHSYVVWDIRFTVGETNGFVPVQKFSKPLGADLAGLVGSVGDVVWCEHEEMTYFPDAGGVKGSGHKSTTGTSEDVFASLIFSEEAFGITPLGGYGGGRKGDGIKAIVKNIGSGGVEDALDQRASVGWKTMQVTKRLQENWMYRVETGATA
jgi:N4-gp56 family major capsid protein